MSWVILGENKTYYECMTGIGPCFGATKEEAKKFQTKKDAIHETFKHSFAFFGSEIEEIKE